MKKTILLFALISLFVISCQKDEIIEQDIISIEDAQAWFEENISDIAGFNSLDENCKTIYQSEKKRILWDQAKSYKIDKQNIIEAPVIFENQRNLHEKGYDKSGKSYLSNIRYITIEENGIIEGKIMTFIPDNEFLKNHNYASKKNAYKKVQKDFTGMILYHSYQSDFVAMLKLQNIDYSGMYSGLR